MSKTPRTEETRSRWSKDLKVGQIFDEMAKLELELAEAKESALVLFKRRDQWREIAEELAEFHTVFVNERSIARLEETLAKFDEMKKGAK